MKKEFVMHYMANDLKGNYRHFCVYIRADSEDEAYIEFHKIGYSGWFMTTDKNGNIHR